MFFHVLSFSFILLHFLSFSFIFFHFLSFAFLFFPFFLFFFFVGCSIFFWPRLPHDFLLKPLGKKSFWEASSLFFSSIFPCFFIFVFFFNFFPFFPFFSFAFPFFIFYSFIFLLFSFKKSFFLFHFVALFSFLGCSKSVAALQDSLGKSAHSELALFALCWLVVTLPCGIMHILVMIRLRVAYGGRWVKSYLRTRIARLVPSMRRLTHLSQVSLLFSPLLFISVLSILISSPDSSRGSLSQLFPGRLHLFPRE